MSIAFVLKGYPRLSETFIAQEILGLERRGLDIDIYSLRHPTDKTHHPVHGEIKAKVNYLPEYLTHEPMRLLGSWAKARRLKGFNRAYEIFKADYARDKTANRIRRFGQACVLASELPKNTTQIHFHFLHTPASVARYAAIMCGLPLSGSAHAKDIWTSPDWELTEKLSDLEWLVTCTAYGANHLRTLSPDPTKVILAYHGLDLIRFPETNKVYSTSCGRETDKAVQILSVGRAVPKKGYDDLFTALGNLPKQLNWHFTHIGGGSLLKTIKKQAEDAGILEKVKFLGAQPQAVVLDKLKQSDVFVLASKVAEDGDRDGLPNVLMEAQSQGLCVLSTTVSAVPELVDHYDTGYLVEPGNHTALKDGLETLIIDANLREKLARAGEEKIRQAFNSKYLLNDLVELFKTDNAAAKAVA